MHTVNGTDMMREISHRHAYMTPLDSAMRWPSGHSLGSCIHALTEAYGYQDNSRRFSARVTVTCTR